MGLFLYTFVLGTVALRRATVSVWCNPSLLLAGRDVGLVERRAYHVSDTKSLSVRCGLISRMCWTVLDRCGNLGVR